MKGKLESDGANLHGPVSKLGVLSQLKNRIVKRNTRKVESFMAVSTLIRLYISCGVAVYIDYVRTIW